MKRYTFIKKTKRFSQKKARLAFLFIIVPMLVYADDIKIQNIELSGQDISSGANHANNFTMIQMDLSWQNSWRTPAASGLNNWDAAWVFVKFRKSTNGIMGPWQHARLAESGHTLGSGTDAILSPELLNPSASFNASSNPVVGLMVYRAQNGTGAFIQNGLKLKWNYGQNNINDNDIVEVKVFAVEMVYIPGGAYDLGDGTISNLAGQFTKAEAQRSYRVQSENAITLGGSTPTSLQNNNSVGMETADDFSNTTSQTLPADFPKGFQSFYIMKYEISQQQYVDFLNTLSRDQQNIRTASDLALNTTSVSNRFVMSASSTVQNRNGIRCDATIDPTEPVEFYCDLNANGTGGEAADGQWLACNFLNWADVATYLDWSGLRPMTELEYEKASKGNVFADSSDYAWASRNLVAAEALSNAGQNNESVSTAFANAAFGDLLEGPVRVGAFSRESFGRLGSGSGLYGAMELSGNLSELCISIGNSQGRSFTGLHGDGTVSSSGTANASNWPGIGADGIGLRGGSWKDPALLLRTSDRKLMNENPDSREATYGGRGVRTAGCQLPTSMPDAVTGDQYASVFSAINLNTGGGADGYLWTLPKEFQLLTGQGTDAISAISPGSFQIQPFWNIHVSALNTCGAGPERIFEFRLGHFSNYDSAFIYEGHVVYVYDQVGNRQVSVFENLDSVKVVVVGGGGNGGLSRGGGGGSGHVRIRNDINLITGNFDLKVGNTLESSDLSNLLIANPGTTGGDNRGIGGNGGSGGGGTGSTQPGGDGGTNGTSGSGSTRSAGGLGGNFDSLTLLNETSSLFSPGTGGTRGCCTGGAGGGGGGLVFNNSQIRGGNGGPQPGWSNTFGNAEGGEGYGAGGGGRGYSGGSIGLGAQGIIVIAVKIQ